MYLYSRKACEVIKKADKKKGEIKTNLDQRFKSVNHHEHRVLVRNTNQVENEIQINRNKRQCAHRRNVFKMEALISWHELIKDFYVNFFKQI